MSLCKPRNGGVRWPPAAAAVLPLLLAALVQATLGLDECLINPTLPACVDYTIHEAVLADDLARLCSSSALGGRTYSGWPAACTLWNECQQGRGSGVACQPLTLLQTACNEAVLSAGVASQVCMRYMSICAPMSVVRQCLEQPPIRVLKPAMQYHSAVQQLCQVADADADASASTGAGADAGGKASAAAGAAGPAAGAPAGSDATGGVTALDVAGLPPACASCSALSFDPNKVTVQALEANCPDPLGTLATLCIEDSSSSSEREDSCTGWVQLCASEEGRSFPALCGGTDGTPGAPAPSPAAAQSPPTPAVGKLDAPAPAPGEPAVPAVYSPPPQRADAAAAAGAGAASCYANPRQESCRAFQHSDIEAEADIRQLCGSMPGMVGCSLWQQCSTGAAMGRYCQPFSVLGTLCLPNPEIAGCQNWATLCSTAGSVVQQCITAAPVRNVLMTSQTMDAVEKACSSQSGAAAAVSGCEQCAAGWSQCPDPLAVMGRLCQGPSSLPACANFAAMCAEAGGTFTALCGSSGGSTGGSTSSSTSSGAGGGTEVPDLRMYLHASMSAMILFQSWVPTSGGAYVASCLAVMVVAITVQALKALNLRMEARWAGERMQAAAAAAAAAAYHGGIGSPGCGSPAFSRSSMDGKEPRRSSNVGAPMLWRSSLGRLIHTPSGSSPRHHPQLPPQPYVTKQELARNLCRSLFTGAVVWLDYMLMLVAMTFNLGLILAATLGFCLGALAFGHWGERASAASAASRGHAVPGMVGSMQPTSENDLEVHYVAPQLRSSHQHQHHHPPLPPLPLHQPPILSIQ